MAHMAYGGAGFIAQYVRTKSFLHKTDSLSKLFTVLGISVWTVMIRSNLQLGIAFGLLVFAVLVLGKVPFGVFLRGARIFFLFGLGWLVMHILWYHEGQPVLELGFFTIHSEGLKFGIAKLLMACTFGLSTFGFIWTTSPREAVVGLVHLGVPYRFAWGIFLVLRYVPLFESELRVIREAQQIRGIREGAGISGKIEMWKRYTMPLLTSMVRKATAIAVAMDCRAFGAHDERTFRDEFHWTKRGIAMMALIAVAIVSAFVFYGDMTFFLFE